MRKVIAIGESNLDIRYRNNIPAGSFVGGRIMNAAASLAISGVPVSVVSECGADGIGDMIVRFLTERNVNISSIDRYTEGETAMSVFIENNKDDMAVVNYGSYPLDRFDVVWPRIDEDDIVIFGSFYSVDPALRERLFEMITYAAERKAVIVYLPGFRNKKNLRITKVMTAILENLEISNIVIGHYDEMKGIFGEENPEKLYKDRISFYTPNYIHLNCDGSASLFSPLRKEIVCVNAGDNCNSLGWSSGFYAGIIYGILDNNIKHNEINKIDGEVWGDIINTAYAFACNASSNMDNSISLDFAKNVLKCEK